MLQDINTTLLTVSFGEFDAGRSNKRTLATLLESEFLGGMLVIVLSVFFIAWNLMKVG